MSRGEGWALLASGLLHAGLLGTWLALAAPAPKPARTTLVELAPSQQEPTPPASPAAEPDPAPLPSAVPPPAPPEPPPVVTSPEPPPPASVEPAVTPPPEPEPPPSIDEPPLPTPPPLIASTSAAAPVAPVQRPRPRPPRRQEGPPAMPATTPIAAPAGPSQPQAAGTPAAPPHPPADYIGRIQARLLAVKRYPAEARARGEEGTVLLRFVLAADGEVLSARVIRSSGVTSLDTEGLAMIARAAPFPPLPDELRATPLALAVPVTFSLRSR